MQDLASSLSALLNVIAPRRCLICSLFLSHPLVPVPETGGLKDYLCPLCLNMLKVCETGSNSVQCVPIDRVFSGYQYAGAMARIIPAWKYHRRNEFFPLIETLVHLIISRLRLSELDFDLVLAIPLSRSGLRKRDFNQALFIASCSAAALNLPLVCHQLVKDINTPQQASLNRSARAHNLSADTFRILDREVVEGRKIMLCDDVLTTGATLKAAAGTLKNAGAVSISALTLARVEL